MVKRFITSLNQEYLKLFALITMTLDHMAVFFPIEPFATIMRLVGRTSFPIFSFLLMMHLSQKQIYKKYLIRLGCFGILSFVLLLPFQLKLDVPLTLPFNILISFFTAVLTLACFQYIQRESAPPVMKTTAYSVVFLCLGFFSFACQYSFDGFCYLLCWYFYFQYKNKIGALLLLIFSITMNTSLNTGEGIFWLQGCVSLTTTLFLLMLPQPDKPHPRFIKQWWLFYAYYPAHLILLSLIACLTVK